MLISKICGSQHFEISNSHTPKVIPMTWGGDFHGSHGLLNGTLIYFVGGGGGKT